MRQYEVVYIFRSGLDGEEIGERLDSYHERLTSGDAEITALEHWGKRELAYPIQKQRSGYYVVAQFRADPSLLEEFERVLELDDDLLRHLVVLSEGELPTPPSARGAEDEDTAGEEDDEDEEELDEDDEDLDEEEEEDDEEDDEGDEEEESDEDEDDEERED